MRADKAAERVAKTSGRVAKTAERVAKAAGRSAPWLLTAFSMGATWVWAPSMFTAAGGFCK